MKTAYNHCARAHRRGQRLADSSADAL